ncbi:MAG: SRPBCC family protein [Actinomycetes bacterium]
MQTLDTDSATTWIAAPPEAVYAVVSDVTRTPELSPEILSCEWLDGTTGPAVGARFRARNKAGRMTWHNKPVVVTAEPGRGFAFARTEPFAGTVEWRYRLEPEDGGTRVTESYEVTRPITRMGWFIIGGLAGCKDRRSDLRRGMEQTLERLKTVVEEPAGRPAATG